MCKDINGLGVCSERADCLHESEHIYDNRYRFSRSFIHFSSFGLLLSNGKAGVLANYLSRS